LSLRKKFFQPLSLLQRDLCKTFLQHSLLVCCNRAQFDPYVWNVFYLWIVCGYFSLRYVRERCM